MQSSLLEVFDVITAAADPVATAKVYHLLDEAEPFSEVEGGAISRWAANVLRDSDETVVCPDYDASWGFDETRLYRLANWQKTDPIHPILYRMPWVLQKAFYLRIFKPLLEQMNRGDVLYVHNRPECASVLSTVAARYGITVVLHMHNSHLTVAKKQQLAALKKTPIVFVSNFLRREIEHKVPGHFEKTFVVYNGADVQRFFPVPFRESKPVTVVSSGRLVDYKGAHVLLDAMRLLEKKKIDVQCKIIGGSWFGKSRTTGYVKRLHRECPSNTALLGYKAGAELGNLLRDADIFCCPSIWNDPFPLAPIEAMATGLPVVASRVGGIPEALQYGGGLMVSPEDPVALADALEALARDPNYRMRLREEGIHAADRRFRWSNVREQYDAVIEKVSS
jgi:spore coat protein SA